MNIAVMYKFQVTFMKQLIYFFINFVKNDNNETTNNNVFANQQ